MCLLWILYHDSDLKKKKWLDTQCLKGTVLVLRQSLFIAFPFLCHCCSFKYCTCPLVACFRLSRGGWVLKCVWQKKIFCCCMQSAYNASKGKNMYRMAGSGLYYIVMPSVMQLSTCSWTKGALTCKISFIFHSSTEVFCFYYYYYYFGVGAFITITDIQAPY